MVDKVADSVAQALAGVRDGATVMIGGFGTAGIPNELIDGLIELIPDDTALPTYAGTYREKVDGVVVSSSAEEDTERVGQYRLSSTLRGTDGSTLQLHLAGKVTYDGQGRLVVSRDEFSCT